MTDLERPFMDRLSALIVFFNTDGGFMFKIFVGRDEAREGRSARRVPQPRRPARSVAHDPATVVLP
jgi:heme iron utilization protein